MTFASKHNRGFSLPMVLIFLIVISLLATVGLRRATVGEALSRNQIEREVARQAAEAALRDAERDIASPSSAILTNAYCARNGDRPLMNAVTVFDSSCTRGQCYIDDAVYDATSYASASATSFQPWWDNNHFGKWNDTVSTKPQALNSNCSFTGGVPLGTFTGAQRLAGVAKQPEYMFEYFVRGEDKLVRISARGFANDSRTEVVLQTYFRPFEITVLN